MFRHIPKQYFPLHLFNHFNCFSRVLFMYIFIYMAKKKKKKRKEENFLNWIPSLCIKESWKVKKHTIREDHHHIIINNSRNSMCYCYHHAF